MAVLDIFLCLFGGPIVAGNLLQEAVEGRAYDKKSKACEKNDDIKREKWLAEVYDAKLENEMTTIARAHYLEEPYRSEIIAAIEEINSYSGAYERVNKYVHNPYSIGITPSQFDGLRQIILLANRGKLPYWEATQGFTNIVPSDRHVYDTIVVGSSIRYRYDLTKWVSLKLKEHGVKAIPVRHRHQNDYQYLTEENGYGRYDYTWEPLVPWYQKIDGKPDSDLI